MASYKSIHEGTEEDGTFQNQAEKSNLEIVDFYSKPQANCDILSASNHKTKYSKAFLLRKKEQKKTDKFVKELVTVPRFQITKNKNRRNLIQKMKITNNMRLETQENLNFEAFFSHDMDENWGRTDEEHFEKSCLNLRKEYFCCLDL